MGLGSKVIANDNTVLEPHAHQLPVVYPAESTEAETLDTTIAATNSRIACVYRPGHS